MNIELAKAIPLSEILDKLNCKPDRTSGYDLYYKAPWRKERTASLHVNTKTNEWYDHGEGRGGDTVTLVCRHLEYSGVDSSVSSALRWIKNMMGYSPVIAPIQNAERPPKQPKLDITKVQDIVHPALIRYLDGRGLPVTVVNRYLRQIDVHNRETGTTIFALGFENEKGGYEVRNAFYKGTAGLKDISFIRGTIPKPPGIHIFEGWSDFVTAIVRREGRPFKNDTLILNSLANLKKATPYIKEYGYRYAYTWMDNDEAGKNATKSLADFFQTEENLTHRTMNHLYAPYKDVNAWHSVKLGLNG